MIYRYITLIFLLYLCIVGVTYAQTFNVEWLRQAGGTSIDMGLDAAVDKHGDIYITGYFNRSLTIGGTILISDGNSDIFIAKYNASGDLKWAKRAGGTGVFDDGGTGIAISDSSIYITGYFCGTANFNTPSMTSINKITALGGSDAFVARFDTSGNFKWVKGAGGKYPVIGTGIAASGTSVYITGYFSETMTIGGITLTSAGYSDVYLAKYNQDGIFQWARRAGGTNYDQSSKIAVLENSIYFTGYFMGTANFNTPSSFNSNEITSRGNRDIYVAKFDSTGLFQWAKRAGGVGADNGSGIAVSENSVYITGDFNDNADFNTPSVSDSNQIVAELGIVDIFVAKYGSDGTFQWAKRAGGTSVDKGSGIAISGSSVYITGYFAGTGNFNTPSSTGSNAITSAGDWDIFAAKYSEEGTFKYVRRAGGRSLDQGLGIASFGNSVYLTGRFAETADFNTPSSTGSNQIISVGNNDIFLAKFIDLSIPTQVVDSDQSNIRTFCYSDINTILIKSDQDFEAYVYTTTGVFVGKGAEVRVNTRGVYIVKIITPKCVVTHKVLVE